MPQQLGRPLAVISTTTVCDGRYEHEARIITDGTRSVGYLLGHTGTDLGTACVTQGGGIEYACPGDEGTCTGYLQASLARDDAWTSDPDAIDTLVTYGTEVER